jgi:hypothetical protein
VLYALGAAEKNSDGDDRFLRWRWQYDARDWRLEMLNRIALIALWIVSLVGATTWARSQDRVDRSREVPTTQFIYVSGTDLLVALSGGPDASGMVQGQLFVKRNGQLLPVKLTGSPASRPAGQ